MMVIKGWVKGSAEQVLNMDLKAFKVGPSLISSGSSSSVVHSD